MVNYDEISFKAPIFIVFHIGDIAYADGYIADWYQFLQQVEPITSTVPYMVARFV